MSNPTPTNTTTPAKPAAAPTDAEKELLLARLAKLEAELEAQKPKPRKPLQDPKTQEIDWASFKESDIERFDISIPVIEQSHAQFLDVQLADKSYVARWVNKTPARLGMCLSEGYSFVTAEDMDPNYPMRLQFDALGQYSYGDVVCLKIHKQHYYTQIRRNYERTMAIHGKARMAQALRDGRGTIQLDRAGNAITQDTEVIDPSRLNLFDPGDVQGANEIVMTQDMFRRPA